MGMSETLKAISDPVRRNILDMLKTGKKSAGEISEKFNLTRCNCFISFITAEKGGFNYRK